MSYLRPCILRQYLNSHTSRSNSLPSLQHASSSPTTSQNSSSDSPSFILVTHHAPVTSVASSPGTRCPKVTYQGLPVSSTSSHAPVKWHRNLPYSGLQASLSALARSWKSRCPALMMP